MRAMIVKEFRELRRDRRTLAMLVGMPVLLLVIFGYAADFTVSSLSTGIVGPHASQVQQALPPLFDVVRTDASAGADEARAWARDNVAVVVVDTATTPPTVYVDGSALFAAKAADAALGRLGDAVQVQVLFNPDLETSWVMVPALVGLILAFIGTIITSIGLVRERQSGTLEQLAVMPLRPADVIVGKIAPYFLLASLDMVLVTLLGVVIFGVPFAGNPLVLVVGGALFLLVVLGLGVLISTASQTQAQAIQVAIMTLLPQILLSGFIFPLTSMPTPIRWIGQCLPLTYFVQVSQGVMLRGAGFGSLWLPLTVLAGMGTAIFTAALLRFRRDLAPRARSSRTGGRHGAKARA